jgi:hypothetical protein
MRYAPNKFEMGKSMGHGQIAEFIMVQCLRREGSGHLFLRRDGLENTPERVTARRDYLEAHPDTSPEFRRAILAAGITPGMTRWEATAALVAAGGG